MDSDSKNQRRISRRDNRVLAIQLLYCHDVTPLEGFETLWNGLMDITELPPDSLELGRELALGAVEKLFEVNGLITKYLANWSLDRIERVPLAILRLGVHELAHRPDIPAAVTINEAIEICKIYAGPESKSLINGVLDRIRIHLNKSGGKPSHSPEEIVPPDFTA